MREPLMMVGRKEEESKPCGAVSPIRYGGRRIVAAALSSDAQA